MDPQGGLDNIEGDHSNFIADIRTMAQIVMILHIIDAQPVVAHDQDRQTELGPKITILPIIATKHCIPRMLSIG